MRVLISGVFAGRTVGSGQYTDRLAAALRAEAEQGDQVEVHVPPNRTGRFHQLRFEQLTFPWSARTADVAHVPYWGSPLLTASPTVVTVHDLIPLVLPEYRRRWTVCAYTAWVARTTHRAAAIIADSQHTADAVTRRLGIPAERVHVVPLGVGAEFHCAVDAAAWAADRATADRLDLPERYGLYLGGFDPRKNLPTLLAAWRTVFNATGVPLAIAGGAPRPGDTLADDPVVLAARAGLPAAAWRALGRVADADLPALYRRAAVFAYPSRYEGFGLPPLEALACGTPVVAAAATSLPEVVGPAGILVAPDDVGAWSTALCRVLNDPDLAARLAAAGPPRAARFTWDAAARRTWAVYRSARP